MHHIGIAFYIGKVQCFGKCIVHCIAPRSIFTQVYLWFLAVVIVVIMLVVDEPARAFIIMFINHGHLQPAGQFPTLFVIGAIMKRPYGAYYRYFRMFLLKGFMYHGKALFKNIGDEVFIANANIF